MRGTLEITWPGFIAIVGVAVYVGWIGSAAYFKIADHWTESNTLQRVQEVEIPKLKSYAGCQRLRAEVAKDELFMSQVGLQADASAVPNCPPPPKTTPPVPKQ